MVGRKPKEKKDKGEKTERDGRFGGVGLKEFTTDAPDGGVCRVGGRSTQLSNMGRENPGRGERKKTTKRKCLKGKSQFV